MPAKSKAQQKAAGAALSAKRGDTPVKELKGFQRVALQSGQQANVSFELPVNLLAFFDNHMRWVVEPGEIRLMIGSSSADIRLQHAFSIGGEITDVRANKAYLSKASVDYK